MPTVLSKERMSEDDMIEEILNGEINEIPYMSDEKPALIDSSIKRTVPSPKAIIRQRDKIYRMKEHLRKLEEQNKKPRNMMDYIENVLQTPEKLRLEKPKTPSPRHLKPSEIAQILAERTIQKWPPTKVERVISDWKRTTERRVSENYFNTQITMLPNSAKRVIDLESPQEMKKYKYSRDYSINVDLF